MILHIFETSLVCFYDQKEQRVREREIYALDSPNTNLLCALENLIFLLGQLGFLNIKSTSFKGLLFKWKTAKPGSPRRDEIMAQALNQFREEATTEKELGDLLEVIKFVPY